MLDKPRRFAQEGLVTFTDAGIVEDHRIATQGGFILARESGTCLAMWREVRPLQAGETAGVNAEEAAAWATAVHLARVLLRESWSEWERLRAEPIESLTTRERATVRTKHREACQLWQAEAVAARSTR